MSYQPSTQINRFDLCSGVCNSFSLGDKFSLLLITNERYNCTGGNLKCKKVFPNYRTLLVDSINKFNTSYLSTIHNLRIYIHITNISRMFMFNIISVLY